QRAGTPPLGPGAGRAAALPAAASTRAAGPSLTVVEVALHGERSLTSVQGPKRFDLVGLHWQGAGSVEFRVRNAAGRWSAWHAAAPEADDRPDPGTAEARTSHGWRGGGPRWGPGSPGIHHRLAGGVQRLRPHLLPAPPEGAAACPSWGPRGGAPPGGGRRPPRGRRPSPPVPAGPRTSPCPRPRRSTRTPFGSPSSTTPPARTTTPRLRHRRSCARSSSTTSR